MLDSILSLVGVIFCFMGIGIFALAFKPNTNKLLAIIIGILLFSLGGYILPPQDNDEPEIHYRN